MSKEPVKSSINEPSGEGEYKKARDRAQHISEEDRMEIDRRQRSDPEFIEHTKPEDPSPRPGQLTRDNVNPNIPSGPKDHPLLPDGRVDPNAGGIVDPNTLGMDQSQVGEKPPERIYPEREGPQAQTTPGEIEGSQYSINEPPGSDVYSHVPGMDNELPPEGGAREAPKIEQGQPKVARGPEASDDPDEIEDELDQMEEEGEVEKRGKSPSKKK